MIYTVGLIALLAVGKVAASNEAYVCSFCLIALGLVEEAAMQVHLEKSLKEKCDGQGCELAVQHLILSLEAKAVPEDVCAEIGMCTQDCPLWVEWPVNPIPDAPVSWPIERKLSSERDLTPLAPMLKKLLPVGLPKETIPMMGQVSIAMANLMRLEGEQQPFEDYGSVGYEACGHNISCKIEAIVAHNPIQDHDGDRYSSVDAKTLRGNDWRGVDCDDIHNDVYPGRKSTTYGAEIDHNCNGVVGGNETGSYEDQFCANTQQRGLIMLGDSATAHFHVPPQWITANGWNLDQLVPDALNELDYPQCSWGTGHVTPEECPYQHDIEGVEGVISLYSQLRDRNRCNHNDYQNIGVNGARVTSSMQLVEALARNAVLDHPVLLWFSLIGNDVCNGHPGFDHMTPPDSFYDHAMESLTALDELLPPDSYVISLALFDGEMLYDIMHRHQYPCGTSYDGMYEMMNCLEENPCWGWLNANATVRRETTAWSDSLNTVWRKIEKTAKFKNFKFIFYAPIWLEVFHDYTAAGNSMQDLIEPADGFHPSQTGNAIFAQKFFKWMEEEHPEALGPVNPHNAEIDAMFF